MVSVTDWRLDLPQPPGDASISVTVEYEATESLPLGDYAWELLLGDGTTVPLVPADSSDPLTRTLSRGDVVDATLEADYAVVEGTAFIVFLEVATASFVLAVAVD
jgi:hypothetical protein